MELEGLGLGVCSYPLSSINISPIMIIWQLLLLIQPRWISAVLEALVVVCMAPGHPRGHSDPHGSFMTQVRETLFVSHSQPRPPGCFLLSWCFPNYIFKLLIHKLFPRFKMCQSVNKTAIWPQSLFCSFFKSSKSFLHNHNISKELAKIEKGL